jgi:hypothetical protein
MNERIRELSAQSLVKSEGQWVFSQEKFAELIVRECAELANEETSLPYNSYSEKIKKHFGVER